MKGVEDESEDDEDDDGDDDNGRTEDKMSAKECTDLDVSMWPVQLLLVRVDSLVLSHGENLNGKDGIALEDHIQNNPLHHHYITIVVPDAGQAEVGEAQNAR